MDSTVPAIAASESKVTFMHALGLKSGKPESERLYKLMKEEAVQEYRSVVQGRRALSPELEHDNPSRPRYAYTQIDKSTIQKAITSIYNRAGRETKALYDLGRDPSGDEESNWIIRWMLYHCFRYRDGRNKRSATTTTQDARSWTDSVHDDTPLTSPTVDQHEPTRLYSEALRRSQESNRSTGTDDKVNNARTVGRPLPYDPVRA